jgi:hypothetical protein
MKPCLGPRLLMSHEPGPQIEYRGIDQAPALLDDVPQFRIRPCAERVESPIEQPARGGLAPMLRVAVLSNDRCLIGRFSGSLNRITTERNVTYPFR